MTPREERIKRIMAMPGVIGVGSHPDGTTNVYVLSREVADNFPTTVDGLPVYVEVAGRIKALACGYTGELSVLQEDGE
jgi:hypothetical protein